MAVEVAVMAAVTEATVVDADRIMMKTPALEKS